MPPQGFDMSPDEKWILYTLVDELDSDIMLVENFRSGSSDIHPRRPRFINE